MVSNCVATVFSYTMSRKLTKHLGWWLGRRMDQSASGWTPAAYLEEVRAAPPPPPPPAAASRPPPPPAPAAARANGAPAVKAKPTPPTPPAKRPASRKPAALATPRDSGYSNGGTPNGSGAATPPGQSGGGPSIAGGLAEALRARQKAMQGDEE